MGKSKWVALLKNAVEELNKQSWESAQERMMLSFYNDESERLQCFNEKEDAGYMRMWGI